MESILEEDEKNQTNVASKPTNVNNPFDTDTSDEDSNDNEILTSYGKKDEPWILYEPTFRREWINKVDNNELSNKEVHDLFLKKDWLTDGLCREIIDLRPKPVDINPKTGKRNEKSFEEACSVMFPVGRVFASSLQLQQTARKFLDQWAVSSTSTGKQIRCYYSKPPNRKDRVPTGARSRRDNKSCNCPFAIRFQMKEVRKHSYIPPSFYMVRISSVNFTHTCTLDTVFHRTAMQSGGRLNVDITKMQSLLMLLEDYPQMNTMTLRPLLQKYLPHHKGVDSLFVDNFRRRARKFLVTHKNGIQNLTLKQAELLDSNKTMSASDEVINIDDPVVSLNMKELFRKMLQGDETIWSAIRYLEIEKKEVKGFVFTVKRNDEGLPCAILYMTPRMRQNSIRFGDVLFLDAQQRQFNSSGFPYISPCMVDEEGNVCQGCEAIVVEESIEMYSWILLEMNRLEPRFQLKNIKFIFSDQKVTDTLLRRVGITNTCSLRWDAWHLMNEVWPKRENFGHKFSSIKNYLQAMLFCRTENEWDDAFYNARRLISDFPDMVDKLTKIYKDPNHYSGYYLAKKKGGSLGKNGDAHVEQNHSSVVAYLGQGGSLAIREQIHKLIMRHKNRVQQKTTKEASLRVSFSLPYTSPYDDYEAAADCEARKLLSQYAYEKFFKKSLIKARDFQCCCTEDNIILVWPCNQACYDNTPDKERKSYKEGEHCPCYYRLVYDIQCSHELAISHTFQLKLYSNRWYNWIYYCENVEDMRTDNFSNKMDKNDTKEEMEFLDSPFGKDIESDNDDTTEGAARKDDKDDDVKENNDNNNNEINVSKKDNNLSALSKKQVTYSSLLSAYTELCRIIQNDKTELNKMYVSIIEAINVYRQGGRVFFNIETNRGKGKNNSL